MRVFMAVMLFLFLALDLSAQYNYGNMTPLQIFNSIQMLPQQYQSPYSSPFYFNPYSNYSVWPQRRAPTQRRPCYSPYCYGQRYRSERGSYFDALDRWRERNNIEDRFSTTYVPRSNKFDSYVADDDDPAPDLSASDGVEQNPPPPADAQPAPEVRVPVAPAPMMEPNPVMQTEASVCETCQEPKRNPTLTVTQQIADLKNTVVDSNPQNPAYGMEKLMSAVYQSCVGFEGPLATSKEFGDLNPSGDKELDSEYVKRAKENSPYYKSNFRSGGFCADFDDVPRRNGSKVNVTVGFNYKRSYSFDSDKNTIYHTRNSRGQLLESAATFATSKEAIVGTNCAEAVSAAFYATGLRFVKAGVKGYPPYGKPLTTTQMSQVMDLKDKSQSCLDFINYDDNVGGALKRGDLWVIPKYNKSDDEIHHAFVVESVGTTKLGAGHEVPDPYGIVKLRAEGKLKTESDCDDKIDATLFNFTIIHNSSAFSRVGYTRLQVRDWLQDPHYNTSDLRGILIQEAQKDCRASFFGNSGKSEQKGDGRKRSAFVVRHRTNDKDCVATPMQLEGEECVKGCRGYK